MEWTYSCVSHQRAFQVEEVVVQVVNGGMGQEAVGNHAEATEGSETQRAACDHSPSCTAGTMTLPGT